MGTTNTNETFLFASYDDWDAQDAADEMAWRLEELGFTNLVIDASFVDTDAIVYYIENEQGTSVSFVMYLADDSDPDDPDTEGMVVPMAAIIDPYEDGEYLEIDLSELDVEIDSDCPIHIPDVFDLSWLNKATAKALLTMGQKSLLDTEASPTQEGLPAASPLLTSDNAVRSRGGKLLKNDSGALTKLPIHTKTSDITPDARALYKKCKTMCTVQGWGT